MNQQPCHRPQRVLFLLAFTIVTLLGAVPPAASAIDIVLDYSLDDNNWNWFSGTSEGVARRASLDAAAGFLSEIITNDDWASLTNLNESFGLSDIFQSTIMGPSGEVINGVAETDGTGYGYTISTSNRTSVGANEYVIYVAALAFDSGASSHAKGGWDSNDRRNDAGIAGAEFNTWGGKIFFDLSDSWYTGQNPGIDPTDDYGVQDPNKMPAVDITTDNWDYSTSSDSWKGFDLETIDSSADGKLDLYAVALHELMHALGATSSNFPSYVGVDAQGNLIGENVVATYGTPVPATGGHLATDTQSIVWSSDGIVSEVTLDPNSKRSVRKYLTELDAALLRDLGYSVASSFGADELLGDYNEDEIVDAADYTVWRDSLFSTVDLAADGNQDGTVNAADYQIWIENYGTVNLPSVTIPEPSSLWGISLASLLLSAGNRRKSR